MSSPAPAFDPKHTAMLVMDFQRGVVDRMPGLDTSLTRVRQAIADVRDHGGKIVPKGVGVGPRPPGTGLSPIPCSSSRRAPR